MTTPIKNAQALRALIDLEPSNWINLPKDLATEVANQLADFQEATENVQQLHYWFAASRTNKNLDALEMAIDCLTDLLNPSNKDS